MSEDIKKSVGLIIVTEIPGKGSVAVLRERGEFNFEKMTPESWPGGCQVTAHGKLKPQENSVLGLRREIGEELGGEFAYNFWAKYQKNIFVVHGLTEECKEITTFAVKIELRLLAKIRLAPDSGRIRFASLKDAERIADLTSFPKDKGVTDASVIAMFPDEKETVISALQTFSYAL